MSKDKVQTVEMTEEQKQLDKEKFNDMMVKENIRIIKNHMTTIDGLIYIISKLPVSREKANSHDDLILAKSWFGEVLVYLGEPVINSHNINSANDINEDICKSQALKVQVTTTDEKGNSTKVDANELQSIGHVRTTIENIISRLGLITLISGTVYETTIFKYLKMSRFWMDRELFRLRDQHKKALFAKTTQGKKSLPKRPERQKPLIINKQGKGRGRSVNFNG